ALFVGIFVAMPLLVIPVLLAVILAATLDPLVLRLIRGGRSRTRASAMAVGGGFLAVLAILALAVVALLAQVGDLATTTTAGAASADSATERQLGLVFGAISIGGVNTVSAVISASETAGQVAVILILSTLLSFYFLADGGKLWAQAVGRVRADVAPEVDAAGNRAFTVLGGYMIATGAISLVGAGSQLLIMIVLGIPLAL